MKTILPIILMILISLLIALIVGLYLDDDLTNDQPRGDNVTCDEQGNCLIPPMVIER